MALKAVNDLVQRRSKGGKANVAEVALNERDIENGLVGLTDLANQIWIGDKFVKIIHVGCEVQFLKCEDLICIGRLNHSGASEA